MEYQADTLVIGAGPAGLAVGACLRKRRQSFTILDQATEVGASWRRHYARLHLHTDRDHSTLPYLAFPPGTPRYPSRDQMVAYLEKYAHQFELAPHFDARVLTVRSCQNGWITTTATGIYYSRRVVVATGCNAVPCIPRWPGQELFDGPIIHSSEYGAGVPFRGRSVLVIGFGNSGGEIAIDLHENGARVAMSVRGPVNIIPRDILGVSAVTIGIALSRLPNRFADMLAAPLSRLIAGDIVKLGFRKLSMGPITQIKTTAKVPLIDIGTVRLVREGHIEILGAVREMSKTSVSFEDGRSRSFDAIVLATGFRPGIGRFLEPQNDISNAARPRRADCSQCESGLYFCGFCVWPAGMLREIGIEAQRIADDIASRKTH